MPGVEARDGLRLLARRARPLVPAGRALASRVLAIAGAVALGWTALVWAEGRRADALAAAMARGELRVAATARDGELAELRARAARAHPAAPAAGALLGRVRLDRLGVSAAVREGVDAGVLRTGAGHLPGSAWDGGGHVVLAAHRDSFFRALRDVRPGDRVTVEAGGGARHVYAVERTWIVQPEATWVTEDAGYDALTLITCYPFTYLGSAPERFIVRARRVAAASPAGAEAHR